MSFLSQGALPHLISAYGYGAVAGIVAFESIGIPLPGESTVIAAAIVAGTTHRLDIRLVIAATAAGAILGDNVGFWIGREFGYRLVLRFGRYVRLSERRIKLGQYLFLRYGAEVVFFGRFVVLLRTFAAFLAGANCMRWRRFLVFNIAGGVMWAAIYGLGGYYLGKEIHRLAEPVAIALGAVAAIVITTALILVRRHEAVLEQKAEAALPGPLRPLKKKAPRLNGASRS
ncbi:MAG TPA: DedA family protein [Alphaproteobacteria bacterium]|nr:DedA family protein [Alphaproteobacteria bacterium]